MGIDVTKPVDVYRNLTRKCWSVRQNGKVECHAKKLILRDCTFHVSEAGRQRVLRNKRKNIHAVIRGYLSSANECNALNEPRFPYNVVSYNPYHNETFVIVGNEKTGPYLNYDTPINRADWVDMMIESDESVIAWNKNQ